MAHPDSYREVRAGGNNVLCSLREYFVYILCSKKLDRFYIGETVDLGARIEQHNEGLYQGSYTAKASDWELFLKISCIDRSQSRKIETHIKRMKSKKYIRDLKRYPEMILKLKAKY